MDTARPVNLTSEFVVDPVEYLVAFTKKSAATGQPTKVP